jgi:SAM-dependent methyltransferase
MGEEKVSELSELYSSFRGEFDDFYDSEKHFFLRKPLKGLFKKNNRVSVAELLEIGCGTGGLARALKKRFSSTKIDYVGINSNPVECSVGEQLTPSPARFVCETFPLKNLKKRFDLVLSFGFFHMQPDWKDCLKAMVDSSNRFVNVSIMVRLEGSTVVDRDLSYFYYLDTGERVHSIVQNLFELINFCCVKEMRAKRIWYYGYHSGVKSTARRPLPARSVVYGNLLLELFPFGQEPERFGGHPPGLRQKYPLFEPEINVVVDGKKVLL